MVAWGEVAAVVLLGAIGAWWYRRTRLRRARKRAAVAPPQSGLTSAARDVPRTAPQPASLHDQPPVPRGRSSLDEPLEG
jgi:hypothetical protein